MLTSVRLQGFRGFDDLTIPVSQTTVLLGPNSCGKTSVLHAVRFATAALRQATEKNDVRIASSADGFVVDLAGWPHHRWMPAAALVDLELLATREDLTDGFSVELHFSESSEVSWTRVVVDENLLCSVSFHSASLLKKLKRQRKSQSAAGSAVPAALLKPLLDRLPRVLFLPAFYGITREEEYRTSATVARLLESADQSRIVRNLVARLSGDELRRLNDFLGASVKARIVNRSLSQDVESTEHLSVIFQDTDGELELASGGTGFVALVALYAALQQELRERRGERAVLVLLDEPEAHLHPSLQGQIADTLADLAGEFGAQLILATHSVEMINRLGRRGDDTKLLAIDRGRQRIASLDSEDNLLRELSSFCDLSPFASLQLLRSQRILFHEGPSDRKILDGCADLLYRHNPARLERYRSYVFASLTGVDNSGAADILRRALAPFFRGVPATEAVRIIRVLDHDLKREARFGPWTAPEGETKLTQLDVVWSAYSIESLFLSAPCLFAWLRLVTQDAGLDDAHLQSYVEQALERANKSERLLDEVHPDLQRECGRYAERELRNEKQAEIDKLRSEGKEQQARKKEEELPTLVVNHQAITNKAYALATEKLRKEPAVWQHGRNRAAFVLNEVRQRLPKELQGKLPASPVGLVTNRHLLSRVGTPSQIEALIPEEIRRLLEEMTGE